MICTVEEFTQSITDKTIRYLTRGESLGRTAVITAAAPISLLAVLYLISVIPRGVVWGFRHVETARLYIFQQPMDYLIFCLFVADILQAIGTVMDIRWMGKDIRSMVLTSSIVGAVWFFIILMVILGNVINQGQDVHYEAPTPCVATEYWCSISEGYLQWPIWGEYIWFWITFIISTALYVPLYFWSRGNVKIDNQAWWNFSFQLAGNSTADPALRGMRRRPLIMLAYPLVYFVSILPLSIVRWITFVRNGDRSVPGTATRKRSKGVRTRKHHRDSRRPS